VEQEARGPAGGAPAPIEPEELLVRLRAAVARACPHWLASEREDLVQAAAVRVLQQLRADPEREMTATYVWKTATSVVIDEVRRARHGREQALDGNTELSGPTDPRTASPERRLESARLGDALRACVGELEPARRHVVVLHLLGHKPAEIAELLACNAKKVSNLVFRATAALRRCLTARGVTG
jgi:RNA polymerase sigma factor (sigma-70 family)